MAASPFPSCAFEDDVPEILAPKHYIGDSLSFAYTFLQPKLDANGNVIRDAAGIPVPDPTNPVILTGSTMRGELYVPSIKAAVATLSTSIDDDTNLALGKFTLVAPDSVNDLLKPDAPGVRHLTRLAVIRTDALGKTKTLAILHFPVATR